MIIILESIVFKEFCQFGKESHYVLEKGVLDHLKNIRSKKSRVLTSFRLKKWLIGTFHGVTFFFQSTVVKHEIHIDIILVF